MRGILITIVLIIMIGASIHFSDIDLEKSPEEIAFVFLEQLLSANPDSNSEISDTDVFNKTNIESYISLNYSSIATEKMMKDLYKNNYVMLSSDIALIKDNKNLKVDTLRIFTNELIDYK